jgi:hypothetical protein
MLTKIVIIIFSLILLILIGLNWITESVEYGNDSTVRVTCHKDRVNVNGWIMDSGLFIVGDRIVNYSNYDQLLVYKSLYNPFMKTGQFNFNIPINQNLDRIVFGKNKFVIWNKNKGCIDSK